jgi:lipid-A-disaccharide synthase
MRLFFSAGEASGDAYAAEILKRTEWDIREVEAVGGRRLASTGASIVSDSSDWGAMGIYEALKLAPKAVGGYKAALRALRRRPTGVFVPIDFGYMNIKLARRAKQLGWKVIYFVPPGSWRRQKQGADLPEVTDHIVTPFPWSAEILNQMGADAHYYGHPLMEMVDARQGPETRSGIAALPGSRLHEIERNLLAVAETAAEVDEPVKIAAAPTVEGNFVESAWKKVSTRPAEVVEGDTYGVLKGAKAAVVCSGTATLEAAFCNCPTVVIYRSGKMMEWEYKIRKPEIDYISLPNILLNRPLLPELLGPAASRMAIVEKLSPLLSEGPERNAQLQGFQELRKQLGDSRCLEETARLISTFRENSKKRAKVGTKR